MIQNNSNQKEDYNKVIVDNYHKKSTHKTLKYILLFFAIVAILGIALILFSGHGEARLCVWDGGAVGALASIAANWDIDTAPVYDDDILFDGLHLVNASADDSCTWDLDTDSFGTFTIADAYSGTITQSSDMYITGFSQAGGVFTPSIAKTVICSGNYYKNGGTLTTYSMKLQMTGDGSTITPSAVTLFYLRISGNVTLVNNGITIYKYNTGGVGLTVDAGKTFTMNGNLTLYDYPVYSNLGIIQGTGTLTFSSIVTVNRNLNTGIVTCPIAFTTQSISANSKTVVLLNNISSLGTIIVFSSHATYTCTLDINSYYLTASSITVGTRGILQCGEGIITCDAITSTSGTITHETATWIFNDGATITCTEGEQFYNVHMKGDCDFVSSVNVTNELLWIDVSSVYTDLDVYFDAVYNKTVLKTFNLYGNTGAVEYTYLPDVQITLTQFYEQYDYSIYAYINSNIPVTYNITGTASSWLSYWEGKIVGMPPDVGSYTYTITATHESGSVDIINGYIIVGSLDAVEYSFDMIYGIIFFGILTIFNFLGYVKRIPLIQVVSILVMVFSMLALIRIDHFEAFILLFTLVNLVLFIVGMVRNR